MNATAARPAPRALLAALGPFLGQAGGDVPESFTAGMSWTKLWGLGIYVLIVFLLEVHFRKFPGPPCSPPQRRDYLTAFLYLSLASSWLLVTGV